MSRQIDNNLSYKEFGATVTVRLGSRIVGSIIPFEDGFCYQSAGSNKRGNKFKTVEEVKNSL